MTSSYEFQPPTNMNAIRSNIMQRIKQRNECSSKPPSSSSRIASKHEIQYLHLDNGLPSPPIESCTFDDEQDDTFSNNTLPDSPPSPVMSLSKSSSTMGLESSDTIREKIQILKQEKHRLFQAMKDLLSQPVAATPAAATPAVATPAVATPAAATLPHHIIAATPTITAAAAAVNNETPISEQSSTKPTVERSRSQSRDNNNNNNSLKSRPIGRSRSISHSEFSRPTTSRYNHFYHERRFYGNDNRNYPYNRSSYSHTSSRSQVAGRPFAPAPAASASPSASAFASASVSTTFRPCSDRHSRY